MFMSFLHDKYKLVGDWYVTHWESFVIYIGEGWCCCMVCTDREQKPELSQKLLPSIHWSINLDIRPCFTYRHPFCIGKISLQNRLCNNSFFIVYYYNKYVSSCTYHFWDSLVEHYKARLHPFSTNICLVHGSFHVNFYPPKCHNLIYENHSP